MNITKERVKIIADTVYTSVNKKQEIPVFNDISRYQLPYLLAKAVLNPNKTIVVTNIGAYTKPEWTYISQSVGRNEYLRLAGQLVDFVNMNHYLPNYMSYKGYKVSTAVYTYAFACIILYHNIKGEYPSYWNFTNKAFTKPTETGNTVYDYFVSKTRQKPQTLDEILSYVQKNFTYQYYYDDQKSNKQVMDTKSGNCTDLMQWLCNMVEPLGYEWKCLHVQCKSGGHVRGQFRHPKHTEGTWINRDPAAVANGNGIKSIWCKDGTLLATNPSWWLENLHR